MGRMSCITLALVTLAATLPLPAGSQIVEFPEFQEFHTWTDLATIYYFTDRFRYDGDYGLRGVLTDDEWSLLYLRPSVRYTSRPWMTLHGGAALFYNFFKTIDDLPELRPWAGIRFTGPRPGGFFFTHYFRLELRAFYLKGEDAWDTVLRGRYQLQVRTPDFALGSVSRLYGLTSIEPFVDFENSLDGTFGDRFRFNFGIGKRVGQGSRIELNYLFHQVRIADSTGELEADDHVVRLRFFVAFL